MMNIIDIYRAIRERLEANFDTIPVQRKDLKTPNPPCFYIKFITEKTTQSTAKHETNNISFDILYFSKDLDLIDLLRVEKALKKVFKKPLEVLVKNDFVESDSGDVNFVEINSISTSLNEDDYILNCTLDLEVIQLAVSESDYIAGEMLDEMSLRID